MKKLITVWFGAGLLVVSSQSAAYEPETHATISGAAVSAFRLALDPATVPAATGSAYPEPFKSRVATRRKQRLGDALGLKDFGVNLTGKDAVYLEVGDRRPDDAVTYPDDDIAGRATPQGRRFTRKDGTPY